MILGCWQTNLKVPRKISKWLRLTKRPTEMLEMKDPIKRPNRQAKSHEQTKALERKHSRGQAEEQLLGTFDLRQ